MLNIKNILEKISAFASFFASIIFVVLLFPYTLDVYIEDISKYDILFILIYAILNILLTIFSIFMLNKEKDSNFRNVFVVMVISLLSAALLFDVVLSIIYLFIFLCSFTSLLLKNKYKEINVEDYVDPIILDLIKDKENRKYNKVERTTKTIINNEKVVDIEKEIIKLQQLKKENKIDEEQYKKELNKLYVKL